VDSVVKTEETEASVGESGMPVHKKLVANINAMGAALWLQAMQARSSSTS